MRLFARGLGWTFVSLAVLLGFAGIASWPPGGLMFALPFIFLFAAVLFGAVGAGLLRLGKPEGEPQQDERLPASNQGVNPTTPREVDSDRKRA